MKRFLLLFSALFAVCAISQAATIDQVEALGKTQGVQAIDVLRVASSVSDGETFSIGIQVPATGVLTSDGTNVSDGDTVTVGSKTYTFKTTLTPSEGEVLMGPTADLSLQNFAFALNHDRATAGVNYQAAAANADVSAGSINSHALTVTARVVGSSSVASTETSSHLSWGASTLAGGTSTLATFEFDTAASPGAVTAGNIRVDVSAAATATAATTALTSTVNATTISGAKIAATRISANEVLFTAIVAGTDSNRLTAAETMAGSNNAWASSTFYGGLTPPLPFQTVRQVSRSANATEAALLTMHFPLGFTPANAAVQVRSSAGAMKAFDGTVAITGNRVDVNSTGTTNIASTDLVTVTASN